MRGSGRNVTRPSKVRQIDHIVQCLTSIPVSVFVQKYERPHPHILDPDVLLHKVRTIILAWLDQFHRPMIRASIIRSLANGNEADVLCQILPTSEVGPYMRCGMPQSQNAVVAVPRYDL